MKRVNISDDTMSKAKNCRQRGRVGKGVFFTTTLIEWLGSTGTLVMLLRLWRRRFTMIISAWWLRTSNKFVDKNSKKSTGTLIIGNSEAGADSSNHEVVVVVKSVRIVQ